MRTNVPIQEVAVAYAVPTDDRPRYVEWAAGTDGGLREPLQTRWWLPAHLDNYGGRDALVVIDSKGEMAVFHGQDRIGTASAPYAPHAPHGEDFWPLVGYPSAALTAAVGDPATVSHRLRDTGWMAAQVDDELGLAAAIQPDGGDPMMWRLAHACTLLGFYPPLGIEFEGEGSEFRTGVDTIGERAARKVKRALMERVAHDRRGLRDLSDRIETNWRM